MRYMLGSYAGTEAVEESAAKESRPASSARGDFRRAMVSERCATEGAFSDLR